METSRKHHLVWRKKARADFKTFGENNIKENWGSFASYPTSNTPIKIAWDKIRVFQ